ncbi:MAG: hypothetical protein ACPGVA_15510 [Pikeienuella sp.]
MGFRIAYLLAQTDVETAIAAFGLTETATGREAPFGEAELWAMHLNKTGWTVIWAEDELFFFDQKKRVSALSKTTPVISCIVNETVMASTAMGWRGGAEIWSVHHQGDGDDIRHLNISGMPPPLLDDLRTRADKAQAEDETGDHFFDVPLKLAAMETGFRYDAVLSPEDASTYHVLAAPPRPAPGFFTRLFGRR